MNKNKIKIMILILFFIMFWIIQIFIKSKNENLIYAKQNLNTYFSSTYRLLWIKRFIWSDYINIVNAETLWYCRNFWYDPWNPNNNWSDDTIISCTNDWDCPFSPYSNDGPSGCQIWDWWWQCFKRAECIWYIPNANCTFNWQTVNHGSSVTAYQSSSVACGSSCVSETRTCNNGVLDGSYTSSSCNIDSCPVACWWSRPPNSIICWSTNGNSTWPNWHFENPSGGCDNAICGFYCPTDYHYNSINNSCDADTCEWQWSQTCGTNKTCVSNVCVCDSSHPLVCGSCGWTDYTACDGTKHCSQSAANAVSCNCVAPTSCGNPWSCYTPWACGCNTTPTNLGQSCTKTSGANSCGATSTTNGTYQCDGSCNATTPTVPSNPGNLGQSCTKTSSANSCGLTNTTNGTYQCDGSCNATAPTIPSESLCSYSCQWSIPANSIACTNNQVPISNVNYSSSSDNCATAWQCKYRTQTCNELGNCSCTLNWQTIPHGWNIIAYQTNNVSCGSNCISETRTCSNGTLSWSYTSSSCNINGGNACIYSCQWLVPANNIACNNNLWLSSNIDYALSSDNCATAWQCKYRTQTCNELWNCPISGVCGSSSGMVLWIAPTTNLCSQWTPSFVTFVNNQYIWTCAQSNGWSSASCIAYSTPFCDTTNAGACTIGSPSGDNNVSCGTRKWNCNNAGQTVNCTKYLSACTYNCTGIPPANSTLCANSDQWLTSDTSVSLVWACTINILPDNTNKCEYVCNKWYDYDNLAQTCKPTQPPAPLTNNSITWKVYISWTTIAIPYVSTYLYSWANVISGTSWASNGSYIFTWLIIGNYSISIRLPDWYDGIKNSPLLYLFGNTHLSYDFPLQHCGSNNEMPCTENNCANPVCLNGCDAWLVVVWWRCVSPIGQLIITKTSITSGTIWADIYYKLSIQNNKNTTVINAMVMDVLPSTVTYISSQPNSIINGNIIYWTWITLLPWATGEYFIRGMINNTATGNITNIWYIGTGTGPSSFITGWSSTVNNFVTFQNNIIWVVYISWTNTPITWILVSLYSWVQNISWYISNTTGYLFSGLNNGDYAITIVIPVWYTGKNISNIINLTWNTGAIYNFPLTPCGWSGQIACDINSCKISPCTLWCDAWLININDICTVPAGQLIINKTHIWTWHNAWSPLSYRLIVTNYKNVTVNNVMIIDTLPIWITYISSNPNALVIWNIVYWTWITLTPNQSINLDIYTNIWSNTSWLVINYWTVGTGTSTWNFIPSNTWSDLLPICGRLNQPSCEILNCNIFPCGSCNILPCNRWCDVWLVNINGICKKSSDPITPGGPSKLLYCRNKQDIYLYASEVKTTDIAWACGSPITEYINICRNNQTIKVIKDYVYLRWFVQSGDKIWECTSTVKVIKQEDLIKYLNLWIQKKTITLEKWTPIPSTGIDSENTKEVYRK